MFDWTDIVFFIPARNEPFIHLFFSDVSDIKRMVGRWTEVLTGWLADWLFVCGWVNDSMNFFVFKHSIIADISTTKNANNDKKKSLMYRN